MSPDYLLRAKSDLRVAKLVLGSDDDYDLLIAAYHVQQAVEKTLKLALKELGVPYTKHVVLRTCYHDFRTIRTYWEKSGLIG